MVCGHISDLFINKQTYFSVQNWSKNDTSKEDVIFQYVKKITFSDESFLDTSVSEMALGLIKNMA